MTISVVNGRRSAAAGFAGLEATSWLSAAGIVLANLTDLISVVERTDPHACVAVDEHAQGFLGTLGRARV